MSTKVIVFEEIEHKDGTLDRIITHKFDNRQAANRAAALLKKTTKHKISIFPKS
jgi:hypothetical protein